MRYLEHRLGQWMAIMINACCENMMKQDQADMNYCKSRLHTIMSGVQVAISIDSVTPR